MILVNNPGSWRNIYPPLRHAEWNGWTPTDLVFPFFLFIVGVAAVFSFDRRIAEGHSRWRLMAQVLRRSIILICLGLIMYGFPNLRLLGPYVLVIVGLVMTYAEGRAWGLVPYSIRQFVGWAVVAGGIAFWVVDFSYFDECGLRVPGVLQRIGLCYLLASAIALVWGVRGRAVWTVILLVGYWYIVRAVDPPAGYTADVTGPEGLLHDWIDVKLLGNHLYRERPDPEGLLSTLPSVATVLLGMLTGAWIRSTRDTREKVIGLFMAANVLLIAGLCMDYGFPINKKIWSSSYVVLTAGLALHFLAMCFWLIDGRGYRRWAWPFVVFGTNAIVVYVASSLVAVVLGRKMIVMADGGAVTIKTMLYQDIFAPLAGPTGGSLLYALFYIFVWFLLLIPLYRWRVFVKI
jgi:predicted acyltransferase